MFPNMTNAYLLLSDSSHKNADVTPVSTIEDCHYLLLFEIYEATTSPVLKRVAEVFCFCYLVARMCGNSERFGNMPLLPPSSQNPFLLLKALLI